jgi:hypothetical protein
MNGQIEVSILPHQLQFLQSTKRYVALCGGFGCGKSWALCMKAWQLASVNAGFDGMLISRSSKQLYDFLMPEMVRTLTMVRAPWSMRDGNKLILDWGQSKSVIHLLTTENDAYARWAGGNMAWACIDEIDTMQKPAEAWSFANDRIRVKAPLLQTACASTPEGYRFLWDFFDHQPKKDPSINDRDLIRGSTLDNPHLDTEYVKSQIRTRNPLTLKAYLYGHFVNLDGVLVYYRWDKEQNVTTKTLADFPAAPLHIGLDFNKGKNPAVVAVVSQGAIHVLDEIYGSNDIDELISEVRKRYPGRKLSFYPDASGFEGIQQLKRAFGNECVLHHKANPKIDRRVASVNERLCDKDGNRRLFVNVERCKWTADGFNRQTFDAKGDPDKTSGLDHAMDALGYFVWWNWPLNEGNYSSSALRL